MTQHWTRRDLLRRSGFAAAAVVGGPVLLGACSKTDDTVQPGSTTGGALARAKSSGSIKVGFANEAPYGFRDKSGKLTGEAPAVAEVIFKALGVSKLEPVLANSFADLIPGLNAGQYDVIAAGMSILKERCGQIAFANPDYASTSAFLVKQGNPKGVTRFTDIAKKSDVKVAVLSGAVEKSFCEKSGVKKGQIKTYPDANAAFQGLLDGRVDAVALTSFTLNWNKQQNYADKPVEVTQEFHPMIEGKEVLDYGGFGFRKADSDLVQAFNTELKKIQDSNQIASIVKPFGFTETSVKDAAKTTTAALCAA